MRKKETTGIPSGLPVKEYQKRYGQLDRMKKRVKEYSWRSYRKNKDKIRRKHKEHFEANKEAYSIRNRKNHIKRKYDITLEVYDELLKRQDNVCAICQRDFEGISSCVDHCHDTGRIRGLLCRKCNLNLHAIEDKNFMTKAIKYLKVYEVEDKEPLR